MSLTLAWAPAEPDRVSVAWLASTRVTVAVSPAGTLLTVTPLSGWPLVPVNVPLFSVMVMALPIDPSLAADSVNVLAL